MNKFEREYLSLLEDVLTNGTLVGERTRTGTYSIFDATFKVDLGNEPFPVLSCREFKIAKPAVEMIGFMRGETNSHWYRERGCSFWNKYGLPEDIYKQVRRDDADMADEYCKDKGRIAAGTKEYAERFKALNQIPYEEGRRLIDQHGVSAYRDVLVARKGDLGPIYGHMWRHWPNPDGTQFDQLRYAFDELSAHPHNRRILINGWHPSFMPDLDAKPHVNVTNGNMSLTPSHVLHEYYTSPINIAERVAIYNSRVKAAYALSINDPNLETKLKSANVPEHYLSLCWFQRSWDLVLAAPSNMAGYAIMLSMMAKLKNMVPRYVSVHAVHVYLHTNHLSGVKEMLSRAEAKAIPRCKPKLVINKRPEVEFIDQFEHTDVSLENYKHHDRIKFPVVL